MIKENLIQVQQLIADYLIDMGHDAPKLRKSSYSDDMNRVNIHTNFLIHGKPWAPITIEFKNFISSDECIPFYYSAMCKKYIFDIRCYRNRDGSFELRESNIEDIKIIDESNKATSYTCIKTPEYYKDYIILPLVINDCMYGYETNRIVFDNIKK